MHSFKILFLYLFYTFINANTVFAIQNKEVLKKNTPKQEITEKPNNSQGYSSEKPRNKEAVSLTVILIILMFILLYFFYQNNKLRQKIKRKDLKQKILLNVINSGIDSQEIERKKIASFLHDNINSLLSSVGLHLNTFTAQHNIHSQEIQKAKVILAQAHNHLRDMSHELVPSLLVRFGLLYALEDLCERNSNGLIIFEFSSTIPTEKRYIEKFEMKLYFIVSELCNNIIKHGNAKKAFISVKENKNQFVLKIKDDGIGFDIKKTNETEGFGLNRIRARVKKFKGSFVIVSTSNKGTFIKIKIPLPH